MVTSRRTAAEQPGGTARAAAEQFRLLVEGVRDYAIFLLDPDGRVASWNAGAERIKGYTAAEILGEHFSRFYTPEDVAAGKPARALATAESEGRFEVRGWRVRKDGTRFYAHVTISALHDERGRLTGFAKITQDVTAEREAEQTLRERERQLEQAQAVARLGSFEWDLASGRVSWSPELSRIFGLAQAPFPATFDDLMRQVHPDDRKLVAMTVRRAARDGTPFRTRARIVRPTGEVRNVSSWGEVARDEHGRPSRLLGVCQDVTEWRQREEQLAEAHADAELSRRLQNGLLPILSLRDPALLLRTRYQPGQERALLGADFYDALELPDGTVATLVGDVAGHGPDEAAVGVALRAAWRALVLTGLEPGPLLDGLDRVLVSNRPSEEMFTTVCCAWVSPDRERVTIALAGHPPPLLVKDGHVCVGEVPAGPALGIDDGVAWQAETLQVGEGWTLLCYTDGLVEGLRAPGSVERFGIEALAETVAGLLDATAGLDELLDRLLQVVHTANGGELSDDIAILCCSAAAAAAGRD
jgi:PAS domain S-box-containing protein